MHAKGSKASQGMQEAYLALKNHSPGAAGTCNVSSDVQGEGRSVVVETCTRKIRDDFFNGGLWCPSGSHVGCCAASSMHRQQVKGVMSSLSLKNARGSWSGKENQGIQGSANQDTYLLSRRRARQRCDNPWSVKCELLDWIL